MATLRRWFALVAIGSVYVEALMEMTIEFQPGETGTGLITDEKGEVLSVSDSSQAEYQGLHADNLFITAINGETFTAELLAQYEKGEKGTGKFKISFQKLEDQPETPATAPINIKDCTTWSGNTCTRCVNFTTKVIYLKAKCVECKDGMVIIDGPPHVDQKYTNPSGEEFSWHGHCAHMDLEGDERQVIMIRHGLSKWNEWMETTLKVAGLFGGFVGTDSPLSVAGLQQVQRLANVIQKANVAAYPNDHDATPDVKARPDYSKLQEAHEELAKHKIEETQTITVDGSLVSDESLVQNLTRDENRLALDILTGRKCDETVFVASNLARAMDTLLIGTLERRLRCTTPWEMSSNLQELEHNADCTPLTQPGKQPKFSSDQRAAYGEGRLWNTADYIENLYREADSSRHTVIRSALERARFTGGDQTGVMLAELEVTMQSPKKYRVWAGHSIWFRHFFRRFADQSNQECRRMGKLKMANTAIISFSVRLLKDSPRRFVAYDCKFVHLHSDQIFKMKGAKQSKEEDEL